ncbi:hypothetical protein JCGZ_05938 [Jatropha curcas]|uniref:Uncharacterized protein n=1 Tax=Jatropha curcas TaxID=180498 RepID=A0A067L070_JATCU|nr:hypothetical protein JCGZ_05938 [Jatropha curcas]
MCIYLKLDWHVKKVSKVSCENGSRSLSANVARACFRGTAPDCIFNAGTSVRLNMGWGVCVSGGPGQLWHGRAAQHGLGRARL